MEDCLFCKIAQKKVPAKILYEDEKVIAFEDIHPLAPVHVLIIPKKHISSVAEIEKEDVELMGKIIFVAKKISENLNISKDGYKLLFRVGSFGGQEINHIHLHLLGGARLSENIRPI